MAAKRIIPCLDVKDGFTVKGVNFANLQFVGDAVEMGIQYAQEGADELVYLDISASIEERKIFTSLVSQIARNIKIPFTVGGGISSIEDADILLNAGADKISINSSAVKNPALITKIASKYGSQFVVVAIDAKDIDGIWRVTTKGGTVLSNKELFTWSKEAQEMGAGEILFTSMDNDGTKKGYACDLYARLTASLSIPVIASGGAGCIKDVVDVFKKGGVDAALLAGILHNSEVTISQIKNELKNNGLEIR